jgi:hypothetical protein
MRLAMPSRAGGRGNSGVGFSRVTTNPELVQIEVQIEVQLKDSQIEKPLYFGGEGGIVRGLRRESCASLRTVAASPRRPTRQSRVVEPT